MIDADICIAVNGDEYFFKKEADDIYHCYYNGQWITLTKKKT